VAAEHRLAADHDELVVTGDVGRRGDDVLELRAVHVYRT
jgi:hypothetical protein